MIRVIIISLAIPLLSSLACSQHANVDITGTYKTVVCDFETSPPITALEITKYDEDNNYKLYIIDGSGLREHEVILYGLEGNHLIFHGQKLATFSDNFATVRHENTKCTYKK